MRKLNIPYKVYGSLSFYSRKEIKDLLAYFRLTVNSKDDESLKRVINYPARGIGQTTVSKLVVAANTHDCSIFDVMKRANELQLGVNAGTRAKLEQFVTMIESFQIENQSTDAFSIAERVVRVSGLLNEYKNDGTPEGITRLENVEELLNGIRDFVEGQKEIADATGSLTEFLADVALATDLDQESDDTDRIALMTIHLAKGLEFPVVYIVGLEEDLFPSAMSMNTRSELEEERRLFYVALTRAEKQAFLSYALSRYRWGKLIDAEPSRFIEEIDESYLEFTAPVENQRFNPVLSPDIFGDISPGELRYKKPKTRTPSKAKATGAARQKPMPNVGRKLKPIGQATGSNDANFKAVVSLEVGQRINHQRFGRGEVMKIEGKGADMKAEIKFANGAVKKLLLRFAKLEILD